MDQFIKVAGREGKFGGYFCRLPPIKENTGHMTKMATMPIYGGNSLNTFFSGTKQAIGFGTWYVALGMWPLQGLHK